ncbi:hypothetical protein D3C81_1857240 [compost metagenome]
MKSLAPLLRLSTTTAPSLLPVSMMNGVFSRDGIRRKRRRASSPFTPGITISSSTRSGALLRSMRSASVASLAMLRS